MVKATFFDVDGTLLSHTKNEVATSTKAALDQLREKNIKCVVATGRHMVELAALPVKDIAFDGYITLNGQLCLDDRRTVIYGNPITGAEKDCILRLFHEKKIPIMLAESNKIYLNFVNQYVETAQSAISSEIPDVGKYTGNEIYLAVAYVERGNENVLAEQLPNCKITRWNDYAVDIISCDGGKTSGIKQYLIKNKISKHETMAFGDGENDVEMLKFVEIGVAMGNSVVLTKASADYVTASVDDDGIEKALRHYGIIE